MMEYAKAVAETVKFCADFVTLILGALALWNLWFRRDRIALLVKVFVSNFTNERVKRIKETLGKLDSLSFEEKPDRAEIYALLGQVSGQIKNLAPEHEGLKKVYLEISDLLAKTTPLSEALKRRIVYELHGVLDDVSFSDTNKILRTK